MSIKGTILSAGHAQGLILAADGNRYTFTPLGWTDAAANPVAGMKVEFEPRGGHAVDIQSITGAQPTATAPPAPRSFAGGETLPTPTVLSARPVQPGATAIPASDPRAAAHSLPHSQISAAPVQPSVTSSVGPSATPPTSSVTAQSPPTRSKMKRLLADRWFWALSGVAAFAILGTLIAVFALGLLTTEAPIGKEIARHSYEGETYALVEYEDELAIFAISGAPVTQPALADGILRSYAWRQVIANFDVGNLADLVSRVEAVDDRISGIRGVSDDVVGFFEDLDDLAVDLPLLGSISAMDVIRESFAGVGGAESLVRALNTELNDVGDDARTLSRAADRVLNLDPLSISADEMDPLFVDTSASAVDLRDKARSAKDDVAEVHGLVQGLEAALRSVSDTPLIGETLSDFAGNVGRLDSELSELSNLMADFETDLSSLGTDLEDAVNAVDTVHSADMQRWIAEPYDTEWPPTKLDRRPVGLGSSQVEKSQAAIKPAPSPTTRSTLTGDQGTFELDWDISRDTVETGKSFTLTVRMHGNQRAGEHGGISVSFPSLTRSGGSNERHASSTADVEVLDYSTGTANVAFHQAGATIYHREGNRQFPAEYLLVESDDATWPASADRTLALRVTPKAAGDFEMQVRGWLCADDYMDCGRVPSEGAVEDQQGWVAERVSVRVEPSATTKADARNVAAKATFLSFAMTDAGVRQPQVSRDGAEWLDSNRRHLFTSRHDHQPPRYFLVHDDIDEYRLFCGDGFGDGGEVVWYVVAGMSRLVTQQPVRSRES